MVAGEGLGKVRAGLRSVADPPSCGACSSAACECAEHNTAAQRAAGGRYECLHCLQVGTVPNRSLLSVFRIRIRFLRIRIQSFFLNPDPVPDPGKEKTFRKAIQKNLGVPTSTVLVLIYLYI